MTETFDNLYIVLTEPKNPGNIGASVRAMKNMGIPHLRLVNPVPFRDEDEQKKMGYRSQDIVRNCREFPSLQEAVRDMSAVFITTSKQGKWRKDFLDVRDAAEQIAALMRNQKIAIVFGREDKGVSIDESQLANYLIYIPSAVHYPSLNLSQAVMVTVYEIYRAAAQNPVRKSLPVMATQHDFNRLEENIWDLMKTLEVREGDNGKFHRSLKRTLSRTHWTRADIAVMDRACKQIRWYLSHRVRPLTGSVE
ncbi:MAG TPA: hypothetical protein ENN40_08880 [Candidatus Aminicenantes bacterium]|nr:hypothetical protein [Candidatus Aminicenantes bacterium]